MSSILISIPFNTGSKICWITQLVVSSDIVVAALQPAFCGYFLDPTSGTPLASSPLSLQPVLALARSARTSYVLMLLLCLPLNPGIDVRKLDLSFIKANAQKIIDATSVNYLKTSRLRGSIFQEDSDSESGAVSSAFTEFYVDHDEPLQALAVWKAESEVACQ